MCWCVVFSELVHEEKISVHLFAAADWQTCSRALQVQSKHSQHSEISKTSFNLKFKVSTDYIKKFPFPEIQCHKYSAHSHTRFLICTLILPAGVFPPPAEWLAACPSLTSSPVCSTVRRVPRWTLRINAPYGDLPALLSTSGRASSPHPPPTHGWRNVSVRPHQDACFQFGKCRPSSSKGVKGDLTPHRVHIYYLFIYFSMFTFTLKSSIFLF